MSMNFCLSCGGPSMEFGVSNSTFNQIIDTLLLPCRADLSGSQKPKKFKQLLDNLLPMNGDLTVDTIEALRRLREMTEEALKRPEGCVIGWY